MGEKIPKSRTITPPYLESTIEKAISQIDCTKLRESPNAFKKFDDCLRPLEIGMGVSEIKSAMKEEIDARLQMKRIQ